MTSVPRMSPCLLRLVSLLVMLTTVTSECDPDATQCEFWLEVTEKVTMVDLSHSTVAACPGDGQLHDCNNMTNILDPKDVISMDGWIEQQRHVVVVNGTVPGPTLEVYVNQTVIVHVKNNMLALPVTIHWHGLRQWRTPFMDGKSFLTQCPIAPHDSFTYIFNATEKGTYWYHSHIGNLRVMGLNGALIVKKKDETMQEHVLMIQEWNHNYDGDVLFVRDTWGAFNNGTAQSKGPPAVNGAEYEHYPFNSALINGRGRYYYEDGTNNGAYLSTFEVVSGSKYRFRIISSAANFPFRVSVDGHQLELVASDG